MKKASPDKTPLIFQTFCLEGFTISKACFKHEIRIS